MMAKCNLDTQCNLEIKNVYMYFDSLITTILVKILEIAAIINVWLSLPVL